MTNQATAAIIEHLCNEARNSVHATFGAMELLRDAVSDSSVRESADIGRESADRLLCSLDDFRDLLSMAPPEPAAIEEFDFALCVSQVVEVLNLASRNPVERLTVDRQESVMPLTQDRMAVEAMLTRLLDTALKLARTDLTVSFGPGKDENAVQVVIGSRDANLALRLTKWLNASVDHAVFAETDDVTFGVTMMLAGKRLRALGGSAELVDDSTLAIDFPSQGECSMTHEDKVAADALHILVAEDCDDSFALSRLVLDQERVHRARTGPEALEMVQKQRFDVVFMDVHMPGMDGYRAIRAMREWETQSGNARTPIVVLSSDDLETQRRYAAQCGCSGYFRKPLRKTDLTGFLDRLKQARLQVA